MTTAQFISDTTAKLKTADIATARLDALVLLEDATGHDRAWLLAHPEYELTSEIMAVLQTQIERRAQHTPLAYIRGKSEFYGREFLVTPDTLQPRAETETMIELLRAVLNDKTRLGSKAVTDDEHRAIDTELQIIDVGTGSGCLAITAKQEWPAAEVIATDISEAALTVARNNARILGADIAFYNSNLLLNNTNATLQRAPEKTTNQQPTYILKPKDSHTELFVLANLPYVPINHTINQAATQEPALAIFGGEDGLDVYRELFLQLNDAYKTGVIATMSQFVYTESLPFQHAALQEIAAKNGYKLLISQDFIQLFHKS